MQENSIISVSIADKYIGVDKRKMGRKKNSSFTFKASPLQWPRLYGKPVDESIVDKTWELRNYRPKVIT